MRVARRFLLLGGAFLAGSAVAVALGDVPIAAGLAVVGLVALLVGRRFRSMEPASIRRGVPGTAEITSVRETGTEVDHVQVVVEATAAVSIAGFAPYEATMRMVLHPSQVESIEPGAVIPVLVEAERPSRVVLDAERGMITRPRPLGGGAHEAARTSADGIVEHGIAVGGILHFSGPTGLVGRDLVPHLRGPGADDPVHQALVSFRPLGGQDVRTTILVRVPRGVSMPTRPGSAVPIRYLPDDPTIATIDWDRH